MAETFRGAGLPHWRGRIEGLEIGRDTDWSVACVLDASTFEEVAMLRTKIDRTF